MRSSFICSVALLVWLIPLAGCVRESETDNRAAEPAEKPGQKSPETTAPLPQPGTPQQTSPPQSAAGLTSRSAPVEPQTLIQAGAAGDTASLVALLDTGADVNMRGEGGETALMAAAGNGQRAAVEVLLILGADKTLKDSSGRDAATRASESGFPEIAGFIKRFGTRHDTRRGR